MKDNAEGKIQKFWRLIIFKNNSKLFFGSKENNSITDMSNSVLESMQTLPLQVFTQCLD